MSDAAILREELARHFAAASRIRHWQDAVRCRPHLRADRPDAARVLRADLSFELERIECLSAMLGLRPGAPAFEDPAAAKRGRLNDREYASAIVRTRWRGGLKPSSIVR